MYEDIYEKDGSWWFFDAIFSRVYGGFVNYDEAKAFVDERIENIEETYKNEL